MNVRFLVALLLGASITTAHAALPRAVSRAFLDAGVPLTGVSVVVQDVSSVRPLFTAQPARAMSAASVMKLVTTFAALDLLGPSYRWRTEAYADGAIERGTLRGNLVLKGYGDPKITIEQWQSLMSTLRASGIERIDGDLVLDRSAFDLPPYDPAAFDNAPLRAYNVGPDALLVNFKSVRLLFAPDPSATSAMVTVEPPLAAIRIANAPPLVDAPCTDWRGSVGATFVDHGRDADVSFAGAYPATCGERSWYVALLDAPWYVHAMFRTYFTAAGGVFRGGWRSGFAPQNARPVAVLQSAPLYDVVRDVNKLSNNVMARQLFLTLALEKHGAPATTRAAATVVDRWLREHRISVQGLVLENGSGLSRTERISALGLAHLLIAADRSPAREEFVSSLAVAATDGTVETRFRDAKVAGQALLKTGTLEGVRAIAGYVLDAQGRRFVVVAMVNHPNAARAQPALDALVQWVYAYGGAYARATR